MALLLEAGEWFSAAEWGQAWLASNRSHPCAPDIALCVATAHYKDTVNKVERSIEHAQGCEAGLVASLKLLQAYSVAEDMQAELQDTLEVKLSGTSEHCWYDCCSRCTSHRLGPLLYCTCLPFIHRVSKFLASKQPL